MRIFIVFVCLFSLPSLASTTRIACERDVQNRLELEYNDNKVGILAFREVMGSKIVHTRAEVSITENGNNIRVQSKKSNNSGVLGIQLTKPLHPHSLELIQIQKILKTGPSKPVRYACVMVLK